MANGDDQNNQENQEEFYESMSDLGDSIIDSFSRLEQTVNDHANKLENLQESAGDTLFSSDFMHSLEDSLFDLQENTSKLVDQSENLKTEYEKLNENVNSLDSGVSDLNQTLNTFSLETEITTSFDSVQLELLSDVIRDSGEKIKSEIRRQSTKTRDSINEIYLGIVDLSEEIERSSPSLLNMGEHFDSFLSEIRKFGDGLKGHISGVSSDIIDAIQNISTSDHQVIEALGEYHVSLKSHISDVSNDIINAVQGISITHTLSLDPVIDQLGEYREDLENQLAQISNDIIDAIQDISITHNLSLDPISNQLKEYYSGLKSHISDVSSDIINAIQNVSVIHNLSLDPISNQLKEYYDSLEIHLSNVSNDIISAIQGISISDQISQDQIVNAFDEYHAEIESQISRIVGAARDINLSFDPLISQLQGYYTGLKDHMVGVSSDIIDAIQDISVIHNLSLDPISNQLKEYYSGLKSHISEVSSDIVDAVHNISVSGLNSQSQVVDALKDFYDGLIDHMYIISDEITDIIQNISVSGSQGGIDMPDFSEITIDYAKIRQSVAEGVLNALSSMQGQFGGGGGIPFFEQAGFMGGSQSGGRQAGGPMNLDPTAAAMRSTTGNNMSEISGLFAGSSSSLARAPQLMRLLTGSVELSDEFPDFLVEIADGNEEMLRSIRLSSEEIEKLQIDMQELVGEGKNLQEISLADVMGGNLVETSEEYEKALEALFQKFQLILGESGKDLVEMTRSIISETQDRIRFQELLRDQEVSEGFLSRAMGFEELDERMQEIAHDIEGDFIDVMVAMQDAADPEDINAVADTINTLMKAYKNLESQGADTVEIQAAFAKVSEDLQNEYQDQRENSMLFAKMQDNIIEGITERISGMEQMKDALEARNELYERFFGMLQNAEGILQRVRTVIFGIPTIIRGIAGAFKDWSTAFNTLGTIAVAIGVKMFKQFKALDRQLENLAESTGMVPDGLREARSIIMDIQAPLMARGATLREITETVAVIHSEMQGAVITAQRMNQTEEQLAHNIGRVSTAFNVSREAAAGMLSTMNAITGATGAQLDRSQRMIQTLATQRDVAPKAVFNDIQEASSEIAKFGSVTAKNITEAAVAAREMGSNLSEVLGIAEQFRNNIVGSIQGLQRAELMLGQRIPNMQELIQASFQGPRQMVSELRTSLEGLDLDLEGPLAAFRLQALADATGLTVERLRTMKSAMDAANQAAEEGIMSVEPRLRLQALNDQLQSSQTGLQSLINTIRGVGIAIVNILAGAILDNVQGVADVIQWVFQGILNFIDEVDYASLTFTETVDKFEQEVASMAETSEGKKAKAASIFHTMIEGARVAGQIIKSLGEGLYELGKIIADFEPVITLTADIISGIADIVQYLTSVFESFGETIGVGGAAGIIGGFTTLYGVMKLAGSAIKSFTAPMTTTMTGLGETADTMEDVASSAGKSTSVLKSFGVQLALIAGSVYVASEAVQNFAELGWGEMAQGIIGMATALGTMTLAMRVMSAGLSSVNWPVMAAAGATMLSFAGSVWIVSDAMEAFAEAGWKGFGVMAASIGTLTAFGTAISALIGGTGGAGALVGLAGAGLLGAFGLALQAVSGAMKEFGAGAVMISEALERISELENVSSIASKIYTLSDALSEFSNTGVDNAFSTISSSSIGSQLDSLVKLSKQADPLVSVANSMERIANSMDRIASLNISDKLSQVEDVTTTSFGEAAGYTLESIVDYFSSDSMSPETRNVTSTPSVDRETVDTTTSSQQVDQTETSTAQEDQSLKSLLLENDQRVINLLEQIVESENALLTALRNGEVAVYMDGDAVTDKVVKKANQRNSRR